MFMLCTVVVEVVLRELKSTTRLLLILPGLLQLIRYITVRIFCFWVLLENLNDIISQQAITLSMMKVRFRKQGIDFCLSLLSFFHLSRIVIVTSCLADY